METIITTVLEKYGLGSDTTKAEAFGNGLINSTWKLETGNASYILQLINTDVFPFPENIAANIDLIAGFLQSKHPEYLFAAPVALPDGRTMLQSGDGNYFRLFPFIAGSHSIDVAGSPDDAYEAAMQFGRFTRLLEGIDTARLQITIPSFHDLSLRYRQFIQSVNEGSAVKIKTATTLIRRAKDLSAIVKTYERVITHPGFRKRVTHHDTKINNVLFDEQEKGLCIIDLDTVMPGYFISDMGDMMRTYLCPVSEEEKDFDKIIVRTAFYEAVVAGYNHSMKGILTADEKTHFFYSGTFMIYMQAIRFLTDYLNNDQYYNTRYEGHNLVRAGNQFTLLQRLLEKEQELTNKKSPVLKR